LIQIRTRHTGFTQGIIVAGMINFTYGMEQHWLRVCGQRGAGGRHGAFNLGQVISRGYRDGDTFTVAASTATTAVSPVTTHQSI